jgi:hypothetical protein
MFCGKSDGVFNGDMMHTSLFEGLINCATRWVVNFSKSNHTNIFYIYYIFFSRCILH